MWEREPLEGISLSVLGKMLAEERQEGGASPHFTVSPAAGSLKLDQ